MGRRFWIGSFVRWSGIVDFGGIVVGDRRVSCVFLRRRTLWVFIGVLGRVLGVGEDSGG